VTPTIEDLLRIKGVSEKDARLILAVISEDLDPLHGDFPDTLAWVRRCRNRPSRYEIIEHAVGELLGVDFDGLEVETAPTDRFYGTYVGRFVGGYANMGDPYVDTLIHSYRDLGDAEDGFEEDGWYVCGWANLLEAAEAHYAPEDDSDDEDD